MNDLPDSNAVETVPIVRPSTLVSQDDNAYWATGEGAFFTTRLSDIGHWGQANSI
jgi:hypothetical protein